MKWKEDLQKLNWKKYISGALFAFALTCTERIVIDADFRIKYYEWHNYNVFEKTNDPLLKKENVKLRTYSGRITVFPSGYFLPCESQMGIGYFENNTVTFVDKKWIFAMGDCKGNVSSIEYIDCHTKDLFLKKICTKETFAELEKKVLLYGKE